MKSISMAIGALFALGLSACSHNYPVPNRTIELNYSPRLTQYDEKGEFAKQGWSVEDIDYMGEQYKVLVFIGEFYVYAEAPAFDATAEEYEFIVPLSSPTNEYYRHCNYNVEVTEWSASSGMGWYRFTSLTSYRREFSLLLHAYSNSGTSKLRTQVELKWIATNAPSSLRASFCNVPGHQDTTYSTYWNTIYPTSFEYTPGRPWPVDLPDARPPPPDLPPGSSYGQLYKSGCSKDTLDFGRRTCRKEVFIEETACVINPNPAGGYLFASTNCASEAYCVNGLVVPKGSDILKFNESNKIIRYVDTLGPDGYLVSFQCRNVPTGRYVIEVE